MQCYLYKDSHNKAFLLTQQGHDIQFFRHSAQELRHRFLSTSRQSLLDLLDNEVQVLLEAYTFGIVEFCVTVTAGEEGEVRGLGEICFKC